MVNYMYVNCMSVIILNNFQQSKMQNFTVMEELESLNALMMFVIVHYNLKTKLVNYLMSHE